MIKRFTVAVAALFALAASAFAAGTIPYSLSQQLDEFGNPLGNCALYLIQAGTTSTPQNGYSDSGLTLVLPNPLRCDASGRLPQFFLADGSIKVRLTKSNGVNVVTADGILVVGASSGGGGGSPVDATTVLATGDVKARYGTGVLSGFVRLNGRTIGSATSGATERANADTQALFEYLWGADANLSVSSGRGGTANADWVANKTLTLPDMRGKLMGALADMGNSTCSSGCITSTTLTGPTTLGVIGGTDTKSIAQVNIPSYTLPKTLAISDPTHAHDVNTATNGALILNTNSEGGGGGTNNATPNYTSGSALGFRTVSVATGVSITGDTQSGGSGTALSVLPPVMLMTQYMKL